MLLEVPGVRGEPGWPCVPAPGHKALGGTWKAPPLVRAEAPRPTLKEPQIQAGSPVGLTLLCQGPSLAQGQSLVSVSPGMFVLMAGLRSSERKAAENTPSFPRKT